MRLGAVPGTPPTAAIKAPRTEATSSSSVMTKIGAVLNHFDQSREYG
jgi:hypothetical protein